MTNRVIDCPTDICLDIQCLVAGMPLVENRFTTVPMLKGMPLAENLFSTVPILVVSPARTRQREQEEEWHTSFEKAISERAERVSRQLRHLSTTTLERAVPETDPLPASPRPTFTRVYRHWQAKKRAIVLVCLGLGLFLVGFDLMGLLMVLR